MPRAKKQAARKPRARKPNPAHSIEHLGVQEYVRKHWGHQGEFTKTSAVVVDPSHGALVILGRLERVVYSTRKGAEDGGKLTDYDHTFEKELPWLAFHVCHDPKCAARGKLVIAGGSYRTENRGIVG